MSVIVKGMKMPDSCINCPFSVSVNFGLVCCPTSTTIPDSKLFNDVGEPLDRQCYCPLIELPPHGRLIDADALNEIIDGGYDLDFDEVPETKRELMRMIDDAQTVIEVEAE